MRWLTVGTLLFATLCACTSSHAQQQPTREVTQTVTQTATAGHGSKSMLPTAPIAAGPTTEVPADCPYIDIPTAQDLEGNRIADHFVLKAAGKPVGCRFMFWTNDHAVLEITSTRFHTSTAAYNAMVATGKKGTNTEGVKGLAAGVDAVLYQTHFYAPDGDNDWACTFAKGTTLVTVKTDQNNTSQNARNIAAAIVAKF